VTDQPHSATSPSFRFSGEVVCVTGVFLFTVALMIVSRQIGQAEAGDSSIWDYVAQSILRGQVPYRDIVEIKLPGSAYMSAAAIYAGKWLGLRDLIAIRLLNVGLVGSLAAVTYSVARAYLASRPVAIVAFLVPLTSGRFIAWMTAGTEPRLGMILFGMLTLLLVAKDRPFIAGLASALSCMCWQPGLLFAGVAFLIFSRYLTTWRDMRAVRVLAGIALPLGAMFLYFAWLGAVRELWSWTFEYTFSVYAPAGFRGIIGNARHIWNVTSRVLGPGIFIFPVAAAGFGILACEIARERRQAGQGFAGFAGLYKDALLIAPLIYALFCLIDFKSASYLIPAIPLTGIFAGLALVKLGRFIAAVRPGKRFLSAFSAEWLVVFVVLGAALINAVEVSRHPDHSLETQTAQLRAVGDLLGPGDQIYVHGATEVLSVLDRPNLNPYIFLDNNKDEYIAARTPGGFKTIVDRMESVAPKVVILSRMNVVAHRGDIESWVEQHYDRQTPVNLDIAYNLYLRKPRQ